MSVSGKYAALHRWLKAQPAGKSRVEMSFKRIEEILQAQLPRSAYDYDAWWRDASEGSSHVQARAWLDAGWRITALNRSNGSVTFTRG
ncbi:MAG: hypothetical protein HZB53_22275 [Chloroflexi bacterium]|nr:hypothetical protein [Chloroflexota bacterium]